LLRAVPGMADFATIGSVFMRSMMEWNGKLMAIVGSNLYSITTAGVVTLAGAVGSTDSICGLSQSTGYAVAVAGRKYWTWNGTTLTDVTSGAGTGAVTLPSSVAYLGGYVIVSQYNSRVFSWSHLADPTTFSGLDFASAEITDKPIIRLVAFKDTLYIFKEGGFEIWAVSGLSGPDAFQKVSGALEEPGLLDFALVVTFPNGLAFVGSDGRVYLYGIGPISIPPVETAISTETPVGMFYYEQRGHGFICLTFRNSAAWCYDVATGEWHEREQDGAAWAARAAVKVDGSWYVGTDSGKIATLSTSCQDFGNPLPRRYVSRTLDEGLIRISSIEAFPRIAGDVQGDGDETEAKLALRTSRDGINFGSPKIRGVGLVGEYDQRLVWRELGQFRRATIEISQSSVTDVPLLAAINLVVA